MDNFILEHPILFAMLIAIFVLSIINLALYTTQITLQEHKYKGALIYFTQVFGNFITTALIMLIVSLMLAVIFM